ncbi:hypothetical protein BASA61_003280 [Batrachochytrium salamandrivorans]|nr:hypothetical protein BASA61_003280 [Batrachochytrium salamandrivorans]
MQFFHLVSFVVVASYAAALPQPAGLSEQYSNNADITLASILEARSYQPVSNAREDSPTLMSLERRAGSARSSEGKSGFSTGNGIAELSEDGEKAGTKIGGSVGDLLSLYVRRNIYVSVSLTLLLGNEGEAIISFIKSIETPKNSSKIFSDFFQTFMDLTVGANEKEKRSDGFIVNILKDSGTVAQNVEAAIKLLVEAVDNFVKLFDVLKTLMGKSESGKTFYDDISSMMESLTKFSAEQQNLHDKIIKALKVVPPK